MAMARPDFTKSVISKHCCPKSKDNLRLLHPIALLLVLLVIRTNCRSHTAYDLKYMTSSHPGLAKSSSVLCLPSVESEATQAGF